MEAVFPIRKILLMSLPHKTLLFHAERTILTATLTEKQLSVLKIKVFRGLQLWKMEQ